MSTLREDFERHMSECGRSVGLRDEQGFYIADQVEQRWQSYQAATERATNIAQAMFDTEGDVGGDDWTPEMAWDWACQQIRNAIRGIDATAQALDGEAGEPT